MEPSHDEERHESAQAKWDAAREAQSARIVCLYTSACGQEKKDPNIYIYIIIMCFHRRAVCNAHIHETLELKQPFANTFRRRISSLLAHFDMSIEKQREIRSAG